MGDRDDLLQELVRLLQQTTPTELEQVLRSIKGGRNTYTEPPMGNGVCPTCGKPL